MTTDNEWWFPQQKVIFG